MNREDQEYLIEVAVQEALGEDAWLLPDQIHEIAVRMSVSPGEVSAVNQKLSGKPPAKMSIGVTPKSKSRVLARDGNRCQYCGKSPKALYVDHILPRSDGGPGKDYNLAACCPSCNVKRAKTRKLPSNFLSITETAPEWRDVVLTWAKQNVVDFKDGTEVRPGRPRTINDPVHLHATISRHHLAVLSVHARGKYGSVSEAVRQSIDLLESRERDKTPFACDGSTLMAIYLNQDELPLWQDFVAQINQLRREK